MANGLASIVLTITAGGTIVFSPAGAQSTDPEGTVKIFVDAESSFDQWTSDPTEEQKQFMRDHYYRMLTYAPSFDDRLEWYPNGLEYRDAYAIYPSDEIDGIPVVQKHPDWVLKDKDGELLYIPFGCSGGSCPQYAGDIGNPAFRANWISREKFRLEAGYLGIWIDDVSLSQIAVGNGSGDTVTPIDPRTGAGMTLADWRRYFAEFMEEVRAAFPPPAEIAHNVNWWANKEDPFIAREHLAADYINLERGVTDSGIRGGSGKFGFESFLAFIDWLHVRGKHVILEDNDDSGIQERDYELAFYFLINNGGDMLAADGDRDRINPVNFWAGYELDMGLALNNHFRWEELFRRDFECGMVLVNQPDMNAITVGLGETFTNIKGQSVDSVTLDESSGQILTKACATRPPTIADDPSPPPDDGAEGTGGGGGGAMDLWSLGLLLAGFWRRRKAA
jgi:hypothetical protein